MIFFQISKSTIFNSKFSSIETFLFCCQNSWLRNFYNSASSQPTTPTTPSAPFSGGHPLAGFMQQPTQNSTTPNSTPQNSTTQNISQTTTPVSARRDVPPSPDAIRGSKTLHRLQTELRDRDSKDPRPSRFVGNFA